MNNSFNAKDADGNTIKVAALLDTINSIYHPNLAPEMLRVDQFLSTNGDGTGTTNANGDYSTPDDFYIEPPAGDEYEIARLIVTIEDDGNLRAERYTVEAALSNGISVIAKINGTEYDMTPIAILNHIGWANYCHDLRHFDYGSGNNFINVRWTFSKADCSLVLHGNQEDQLIVRLRDDLSNLVSHRFLAQGFKIQ